MPPLHLFIALTFALLLPLSLASTLEVTTALGLYNALLNPSITDVQINKNLDFQNSPFDNESYPAITLTRSLVVRGNGQAYPIINDRYIANRVYIKPFQSLTFLNVFFKRAVGQALATSLDLIATSPNATVYMNSTIVQVYACIPYPASIQLLLSTKPRSPDFPGVQVAGNLPDGWCFPNAVRTFDAPTISQRVCWASALAFTDLALQAYPLDTILEGSSPYYNIVLTNSVFVCEADLSLDCLNTYGVKYCNTMVGGNLIALEDQQDLALKTEQQKPQQPPPAPSTQASKPNLLVIVLPAVLGGVAILGVSGLLLAFLTLRYKRRKPDAGLESKFALTSRALPDGKMAPMVMLHCADRQHSNTSKGVLGASMCTSLSNTTSMPISGIEDSKGAISIGYSTIQGPARSGAMDHPLTVVVTEDTPMTVPLNLSFSELIMTQKLRGTGQFGQVVEAEYRGMTVAVKVIHPAVVMSPKNLLTFQHEATILSRCSHPNIVTLLGACLHPPRVFLVEELMEQCLRDVVHDGHRSFDLNEALSISRDVALGLAYLHPTILHRDLKPGNILLDSAGHAKISDFGLARLRESTLITTTPEAGTASYMAPECFDPDSHSLTPACDIYSLGIMINEMVTRRPPWENMRNIAIGVQVSVLRQRPPMEESDERCPRRLRKLIQNCWQHDHQKRPSAAEVAKELTLVMQQLGRASAMQSQGTNISDGVGSAS